MTHTVSLYLREHGTRKYVPADPKTQYPLGTIFVLRYAHPNGKQGGKRGKDVSGYGYTLRQFYKSTGNLSLADLAEQDLFDFVRDMQKEVWATAPFTTGLASSRHSSARSRRFARWTGHSQ